MLAALKKAKRHFEIEQETRKVANYPSLEANESIIFEIETAIEKASVVELTGKFENEQEQIAQSRYDRWVERISNTE